MRYGWSGKKTLKRNTKQSHKFPENKKGVLKGRDMLQLFKGFISILNILWILAALCALFVAEGDRDRGTTILNIVLICTMALNLVEIWLL